jgi:hypothetical protein
MKLRFQERIQNTEDLELQRGLKVGELKRQSAMTSPSKTKINLKMKLGFWEKSKNIKDLELWKGSRNRKTEKKEHDQALLQKVSSI